MGESSAAMFVVRSVYVGLMLLLEYAAIKTGHRWKTITAWIAIAILLPIGIYLASFESSPHFAEEISIPYTYIGWLMVLEYFALCAKRKGIRMTAWIAFSILAMTGTLANRIYSMFAD